MARYEVTVPLVVYVEDMEGTPTVVGAEIANGFPGFFSEAEAASGVWQPDEDAWIYDAESVADTAWDFVRSRIPEGWA